LIESKRYELSQLEALCSLRLTDELTKGISKNVRNWSKEKEMIFLYKLIKYQDFRENSTQKSI